MFRRGPVASLVDLGVKNGLAVTKRMLPPRECITERKSSRQEEDIADHANEIK